jgi:hypothetical protein
VLFHRNITTDTAQFGQQLSSIDTLAVALVNRMRCVQFVREYAAQTQLNSPAFERAACSDKRARKGATEISQQCV